MHDLHGRATAFSLCPKLSRCEGFRKPAKRNEGMLNEFQLPTVTELKVDCRAPCPRPRI